MSGGSIAGISKAKSVFLEFFFKPGLMAGATLVYPFLRWAAPIRQFQIELIPKISDKVASEIWGQNNYIQRYKMILFSSILAHFLEADNAYFVFFQKFINRYVEAKNEGSL